MISHASNAHNVFTDINGLQNINKLSKTDKSAALKEVAQQFESMFVKMMLTSMRNANKAFSEDSLLNSNEQEFYRGMYDDQMAVSLSGNKGVGLAEVIHRQLMSAYATKSTAKELDQSKLADRRLSKSLYAGYGKQSTQNTPTNQALNLYGLKTALSQHDASTPKLPQFRSPLDFIQKVYPHAQKIGQKIGVKPQLIVSQAALETGWGKYVMSDEQGKSSHNLFGIKADRRWGGEKVRVQTHEYIDGVKLKQNADFRAYPSISAALEDYADFLQHNPRYKKALQAGQSTRDYGRELQRAGYATDPFYGHKIENIAQGEVMQQAMMAFKHKGEG